MKTDPSAATRRRALAPGFAASVDENLIDQQVRAFYGKVQADPMLGPIFGRVVDDWEPHLLHMIDFWSSVLLMSGRYKGNPVAKHAPLDLAPEHFKRWLQLFVDTAEEICPAPAALLFREKASMIAQSLELAATRAITVAHKPFDFTPNQSDSTTIESRSGRL